MTLEAHTHTTSLLKVGGSVMLAVPPPLLDLLLSQSLTRRLVNYARSSDVTEGYASDWTIGQLREPAQRIAD